MCKIYAIVQKKGGVAKTTTVRNLAAVLAKKGKRVLCVEFDSQGNLSDSFGVSRNNRNNIKNMIEAKKKGVDRGYKPIKVNEYIYVIPAPDSMNANIEELLGNAEDKSRYLKKVVEDFRDEYDFILIDSVPTEGFIQENVIAAADKVIIPCTCDSASYKMIPSTIEMIEEIKTLHNRKLEFGGIVITQYQKKYASENRIANRIYQEFSDDLKIYEPYIPFDNRVNDLGDKQPDKAIVDIRPNLEVSQAYIKLAENIFELE